MRRRARLSFQGDVAAGAAREEAAATVDDQTVNDQPDPPAGDPAGPASPGTPRRPRTRLLLGLAAAVFALDLATKLLVVATIEPGEDVRLLGGRST